MQIIKADKINKDEVLRLLDDFRNCCMEIIAPEKEFISTTAKEFGGKIFDDIIESDKSAIFLVRENKDYIGIATVHKIPQIRKGGYCAEIEEMYIDPKHQGNGGAQGLIDAIITWAKEQDINTVRLESSNELKRAHGFYEKSGFRYYGRAYEKIIK